MKNSCLVIFAIILFLLLLFSIPKGVAQPTVQNFTEENQKDSISNFSFNTVPEKNVFSGKNLTVFGTILGGAFLMDEWANDRMLRNKSRFLTGYTDAFNDFGDKKFIAPATLAIWLLGKAAKSDRLSNTALNSAKALVTGAILVEPLKIATGRSRPDLNRGSMHFNAFNGNENDIKSLPSGHAFVAWAVFTPFAKEYSKWIYIIPASVSFARMYRNRHWFSDVILGSGIGYFAGTFFHKRKNKKIIYTGNRIVIKI